MGENVEETVLRVLEEAVPGADDDVLLADVMAGPEEVDETELGREDGADERLLPEVLAGADELLSVDPDDEDAPFVEDVVENDSVEEVEDVLAWELDADEEDPVVEDEVVPGDEAALKVNGLGSALSALY